MICPECYTRVRPAQRLTLAERFIVFATPYHICACPDCHWRGLLAVNSLSLSQHFKQSLFGWLLGILLALSIAWLVAGQLEPNSSIRPSGASAEMKWGW